MYITKEEILYLQFLFDQGKDVIHATENFSSNNGPVILMSKTFHAPEGQLLNMDEIMKIV